MVQLPAPDQLQMKGEMTEVMTPVKARTLAVLKLPQISISKQLNAK